MTLKKSHHKLGYRVYRLLTINKWDPDSAALHYLAKSVKSYMKFTSTNVLSIWNWRMTALSCVKWMLWLPSWKCDVKLKIILHQSTCINLKNIPAKFHPDPFEMTEPWAFWTKTRWVAIWDQFLIPKLKVLVTVVVAVAIVTKYCMHINITH